jgi:hypothetical protein
MQKAFSHAVRVTLLALSAATRCFSQSTALFTGSVADPSGANVAGAQVKCRNTETDIQLTATTNAEGLFRFADLPVGPYEVTVTHEGFATLVRTGITLYTGQTLDLNLSLTLGQTAQSVEVSSPVPLIQTTTSDLKTAVDSRQMMDLPLNGRNTFDLAVLTPGSVNTDAGTVPGQADNPGLAVNGLNTTSNNWALDGSTYKNRSYGSAPSLPNPDTLQEFTVQSSVFSADTRGGGASIKMTTRSGTNHFHGTLFEFFRNDALDARNFFSIEPQDYKHNQYGGTAGGAIRRDKLFFFGSFQGTNKRGNPSPATATVPAAAVRSGNFSNSSNTIVDPNTNAPFPGNVVPQSRLDPIAQKLLPYIPLPNSGTNTVVFSPPAGMDDNQYLAKFDYMLTEKDHIMGRYFRDRNTKSPTQPLLPAFTGINQYTNQTIFTSITHTFSSAWVMNASFNYLWIDREGSSAAPFTMQDLGAKVPLANGNIVGNKIFVQITGYASMESNNASLMNPHTQEVQADISHAVGRHFIRFGAGYQHTNDYTYNHGDSEAGQWSFSAARTQSATISKSGDAFASFLLGVPSTFAQASDAPFTFIMNGFDPWIQDDWRVNSRLTVNLGVRWEPALEPRDASGIIGGFAPGVQSTIAPLAPRSVVFVGDPGVAETIVRNRYPKFSPRVGFAWDVLGNATTVVRAGYGFFRPPTDFDGLIRNLDTQPFRTTSVSIPNPASLLDPYNGYPGTIPFPYVPPSSLATYKFPANAATRVLDTNANPGYTQSWNLTIERQFAGHSALSLSYVGNHSIGLMDRYQANPALYAPGATVSNENTRRLYPGIGQLTVGSSVNIGHYNAFQAQFTKRAGRGLNLMASYTWGKSQDYDSSGTFGTALAQGMRNTFDFRADYAPSDYDSTQQTKIAAIYDVPQMRSGPAALRGIVNGWQINTMVVARTGFPWTCRSGVDNSLTGIGNDRCDQINANSARPAGANRMLQWFNTAAFTTNAIPTFGNAGRNDMRRPGMVNFNASVFRIFPLTERFKFEMRVEAFNALNHANLNLFYSAGAYQSTLVVTSPTFGQITSAMDPRLVQIAAKLRF